jgi:hypothetical protein
MLSGQRRKFPCHHVAMPTEPQATAPRLRGTLQRSMYYVACLRRWRSGTRPVRVTEPTDLSADIPCRGLEIVATTKRGDVETRRNGVFDLLAMSWQLCSRQELVLLSSPFTDLSQPSSRLCLARSRRKDGQFPGCYCGIAVVFRLHTCSKSMSKDIYLAF